MSEPTAPAPTPSEPMSPWVWGGFAILTSCFLPFMSYRETERTILRVSAYSREVFTESTDRAQIFTAVVVAIFALIAIARALPTLRATSTYRVPFVWPLLIFMDLLLVGAGVRIWQSQSREVELSDLPQQLQRQALPTTDQRPDVEPDAPNVEPDAPNVEPDAPNVEPDAPNVEPEAPNVEPDEPPNLEPEARD